MNDQQRMSIVVNALFTHDAAGRMVRVNEPDGDVAPRFFLGRTREGHVWRFRNDLPDEVVKALEVLCEREPVHLGTISEQPVQLEAIRRELAEHMPLGDVYTGPEFYFPERILQPSGVIAQRMMHAQAASLAPHFRWAIPLLDAVPVWAVEQDGVVVSLCFSSRTTLVADEAGVYTLEAHRGKGYAPAVVAAWARSIHALQRMPLYGTTWDNLASQRIAKKLNLTAFGAVLHIA